MDKLLTRAFLLGFIVVGGCQATTKIEPLGASPTGREAPAAPPESNLVWKLTPRSNLLFYKIFGETMPKLDALSEAERGAIFDELASGKTTGLKKYAPTTADHFPRMVSLIEGYRDKHRPPASVYRKIYGFWQLEAGYNWPIIDERIDNFAHTWDHQFVGGFAMKIEFPLEVTHREGGSDSYGWRVRNVGRANWPESMMIEPIPTTPTALRELIKPIRVEALSPKQLTEIRLTIDVPERYRGTRVTFISSFLDKSGARRYIRPRPRLGIPEFGPPEDLLTLVL